jgi:hypothetical protein
VKRWKGRGEKLLRGFDMFTISWGANTGKVLEVSSFLYALTELLIEGGSITEKELNCQSEIAGDF